MPLNQPKASGVLLHITSLPSRFGIGDLGPVAYRFVDFLTESKQSYWQILPVTPTSLDYGNSPYKSNSVFAGNPLLISIELLEEAGLLQDDLQINMPETIPNRVNYNHVTAFKGEALRRAFEVFKMNLDDYRASFESFCEHNSSWLNDYALYKALRKSTAEPWNLWPIALRDREKDTIVQKSEVLSDIIQFEKFVQFIFFMQWQSLKEYCRKKQIRILGDLSFYVSYDSADVWAHPEMFKLDRMKRPLFVAGVPPDYFSSIGQMWGNPIYEWDRMVQTQFDWWVNRIEYSLNLFDVLRLDHFRGFLAYWEIPAEEKTAVKGNWVKTPSEEFFKVIIHRFPNLPFIAEDLGLITEDVRKAINKLGIPGMNVLVFGFSDHMNNSNSPYNHVPNSVVYSGTHDTNTVRGWFNQEATQEEKRNIFRYFGKELSECEISFKFIELAMKSVSNLSVIPLQDILTLGAEARMNNPANEKENWLWRVVQKELEGDVSRRLGETTADHGRYP